MARKKQTFDPHALTREVVSATHEVVTVPFRLRTYRVIRKILIIFIAVSIVNVVFANVFYTPKMYRILRENSELVFKYRLLQDKIPRSSVNWTKYTTATTSFTGLCSRPTP